MTPAARSCLCGCGRTFNRSRSMPLCKLATARVYQLIPTLPLLDELNARDRRSNRVWCDEKTVAALLTDDMAEAQRRVEHRAEHGFYADPDRALVGV